MAEMAAAQQAARQAQRQAHRDAQLRNASHARSQQQLKAQHEAQQRRQLTAKKVRTHEPIPREVWVQMETNKGWLGEWLPCRYEEAQLEHWREVWMTTSHVGRQIWYAKAKQAEAAAANKKQQEERRLKKLEEKRIRRERQELYRLPAGTKVRIHAPNSKMHGRVGEISPGEFEWCNDRLWCWVSVEVLPPGHPMLKTPARHRPFKLMPQTEKVAADQLERLHPEVF